MNTIATIVLRDGMTVTGVLREHRGHGIVVVERAGERFAGELDSHRDRRLRGLTDLIERTPGGIRV